MNPDLLKFIELCLVDGVISDKEREVIFRKSKELGVPRDECEIIIEGMVGKHISNPNDIKTENSSDLSQNKTEIKNSYSDLVEIESWIKNFEYVVNEIKTFRENEKKLMKKWFDKEFEKFLKNWDYSSDKKTLKQLIDLPKRSLFSNSGSSIERINSERIEKILKKEKFYGFIKVSDFDFDTKMEVKKYLKDHVEYDDISWILRNRKQWVTYICTNKGIHIITENKEGKIWCPVYTKYTDNKHFYTYSQFINLKEDYRISHYDYLIKLKKLVYSDLKLTDYFNKLLITINDSEFLETTSKFNIDEKKLNKLMRIHNYICRQINDYNNGLKSIEFKYLYGIEGHFDPDNYKFYRYVPDRYELVNELLKNHQNTISFLLNLIGYRDEFLNSLVNKDTVRENTILMKLEDIGVLNTHFERSLLGKMDDLTNILIEINSTLSNINSTLSEGFSQISNRLSERNELLKGVNEKLGIHNLLSMIQTYQIYKINKNTKSLK